MSEIVRSQIIGTTPGYRKSMLAREESALVEKQLERTRKQWTFTPSNMNIILHQDLGAFPSGIVMSVAHEVARMLLHKRLGAILEHDVTIDALIEGSFEDVIGAMGLGAAW